MMGIRYSELIPVLAKAIQELKQEKDAKEADLENENAALKGQEEKDQAEIASLKAANQKLSTMATKVEALEQAVTAIQQSENGGIQKAVLAQ
jgi:predicted  nucleic acid-binding Zn-ribbon protein